MTVLIIVAAMGRNASMELTAIVVSVLRGKRESTVVQVSMSGLCLMQFSIKKLVDRYEERFCGSKSLIWNSPFKSSFCIVTRIVFFFSRSFLQNSPYVLNGIIFFIHPFN